MSGRGRFRVVVEVGVKSWSNTQESVMDVKLAVRTAKEHVLEIFADESIANVGLEEVEFNELNKVWTITIGFSRPWDHPGGVFRALDGTPRPRTFKIVRIEDESGRVQSVKHRILGGDQ